MFRMQVFLTFGIVVFAMFVLAGCGGGSGGSSSSTYVIGGTVSGLTGSGLVLQDNSTDNLAITANGSFTFATALSEGATYNVTVFTQPTNPAEDCTVSNGSGKVTGNVSNVSVACSPVVLPPTAQNANVSLNVIGTAPSTVSGAISASDPQGLPLTYAISKHSVVGTESIDATSGSFTYSIAGNTTQSSDSFTVSVSNGSTSASAVVNVALHADPLLANEWYIQNNGSTAFSSVLPVAGNDMNVAGVWAKGFTGKGVKVAVVDSGLEISHEDLAANVDIAHSYNFVTGTNDPTRDSSDIGYDHGTQVAGIIGAVAFNGKGGRGVAYNASLRGYNLANPTISPTYLNYSDSMGGMALSADNDIFNSSLIIGQTVIPSIDASLDAIDDNLQTLRGGLGAVLVNAAGNYFDSTPDNSNVCTDAEQFGVSCLTPAIDPRLTEVTPIVVGASTADGEKSSYSSTGSSIWVVAPGGEFGIDSNYIPNLPPEAYEPAIVTTARSGCVNASYPTLLVNDLDALGANPFALDCQYTALMNGTSSAAPNTSATVALMLEANPNLGWRDIKYIFANTARKIDPNFAGVISDSVVTGNTVTLEQGWVQNAAGYWFSNWYGFGEVNAAAAVNMAEAYSSYLPPMQSSGTYSTTPQAGIVVPANSVQGWSFQVQVLEGFSTVEEVQLFPNIATTPALECNQIEVVSPSGTKSILLHAATGLLQPSVTNARLLSNAFYGEPVNGTWTVTYYNFCPASSGETTLSATLPQSISFIGH